MIVLEKYNIFFRLRSQTNLFADINRSTHLFRLDAQFVAVLKLMIFAKVNDYFAGIYDGVGLFLGHAMGGCKDNEPRDKKPGRT